MPRDGQTGGRSDGDFSPVSLQNLKAYKYNVLIVPFHSSACWILLNPEAFLLKMNNVKTKIKRSGILSNNVIKTMIFEMWTDLFSDVWNSLEFPYSSLCISLNLTEADGKHFLKCATILKNTPQYICLSGKVLLILRNSVHSFGELSTDASSWRTVRARLNIRGDIWGTHAQHANLFARNR